MDVYPWEPEKNGDKFTNTITRIKQCVITPHIGGSTQEAQNNIGEDVSIKLYNYLEKGMSFARIPCLQ